MTHSRFIWLVLILLALSGVMMPRAIAAYDSSQISTQDSGEDSGLLSTFSNSSDSEQDCVAKNILSQLDDIANNLSGFIKDQIGNMAQEMLTKNIKEQIMCSLSNIWIFGYHIPFPQCEQPTASDAAAEALKQKEQDAKQNFIGRCTAAASLQTALSNADELLNSQGPDGGMVAVTNWIDNLNTEPDRQGMRRFWTILVNTGICPYFREEALDYFDVPQSYRNNPPPIGSTELNTSADDPFQLRGSCTLPKDFVPGMGQNDAASFAAAGGFTFIEELAKPQNNLTGFIDMGEAELAQQRTVSINEAHNEAVSGGGFRSVYGPGTSGCQTLDPNGQCVDFARVRQPPGAAEAINNISKFEAPILSLTNQNGTSNPAVQDMTKVFANNIEDISNQPLPFRIKFGLASNPTNYKPSPTPAPVPGSGAPNDPLCNTNPQCTCATNVPGLQTSIVPGIAAAMKQLIIQDPLMFSPMGSSIIAPGVTFRQVTQELSSILNAGQGTVWKPHPTLDNEIVLVGAGQTISFDVITPTGSLRTNGGTPVLSCDPGVMD